jgi:hypothetical protein
MLFKNSVRTSKRTPHFTIAKINWLTLFKEIIPVYHAKPINTKRSIMMSLSIFQGFKILRAFPPSCINM